MVSIIRQLLIDYRGKPSQQPKCSTAHPLETSHATAAPAATQRKPQLPPPATVVQFDWRTHFSSTICFSRFTHECADREGWGRAAAARLCHAGYGPYMGGNTPSSGYVGVYLAMQMCSKVAVYGFGVKEVGGEKVSYHYYTGYAARKVSRPPTVHAGCHLRERTRHAERVGMCVQCERGRSDERGCLVGRFGETCDGIRFGATPNENLPSRRHPSGAGSAHARLGRRSVRTPC